MSREDAAFLPDALALQESPPSPFPRASAWTISILFLVVVVYSIFAKIDIVAIGSGTIVDKSRSRSLSTTATARLLGFRVSEGQEVEQGQILADLDEEFARAEVERVRNEFASSKTEFLRSQWLLSRLATPNAPLPPRDSSIDSVRWSQATDFMKSSWAQFQSNLDRIDATIGQKQAELATGREVLKRLESLASSARSKADDYARLSRDQLVSKHDLQDRQQESNDREGESRTQVRRMAELEVAIRALEVEREGAIATFRKDALEARETQRRTIDDMAKQLEKAEAILKECHLRSPVKGTVQQLSLQNVGGVVVPGTPVLVVVPLHRDLEIEARVQNQDVGFLATGMDATIKVAAFPYTKYGSIEGKLVRISNDAIPDEKLGSVFLVNASMARDVMMLEKREVRLSQGLQVSLEIKTGRRRLIEYFLSPLIQKGTESFRER